MEKAFRATVAERAGLSKEEAADAQGDRMPVGRTTAWPPHRHRTD